MPWSLSTLDPLGIVFTVYTEPMSPLDLRDAVLANFAVLGEKGFTRILSDCTALAPSGSALDIYELARFIDSLGLDPGVREAVILPVAPGAAEDLRFYETVTTNRGFQVRVFTDRDAAVAWLTDPRPPSPAG